MEKRIRDLIVARLGPDSEVRFDQDTGMDRVYGTVISDRFDGLVQSQRQRLLWDTLREGLNPDELSNIGLLLTVSPAEYHAILDEAA